MYRDSDQINIPKIKDNGGHVFQYKKRELQIQNVRKLCSIELKLAVSL